MSMSDMVVLGAWHRLFQACAIFTILRVVKVIQAPGKRINAEAWFNLDTRYHHLINSQEQIVLH
jgi:hypothetical protein